MKQLKIDDLSFIEHASCDRDLVTGGLLSFDLALGFDALAVRNGNSLQFGVAYGVGLAVALGNQPLTQVSVFVNTGIF